MSVRQLLVGREHAEVCTWSPFAGDLEPSWRSLHLETVMLVVTV